MPPKTRNSILYIDDEPRSLTSFKLTFKDEFEVHTANSCAEALEVLRQHTIQLIVADQRMPDQTGVEFLRQVRTQYPLAIRTILTGYSDIEAVIDAINKSHVYFYFKKPWREEELKIVFRNAIEAVELSTMNSMLTRDLRDALEQLENKADALRAQVAERQDLIEQLEISNNAKSQFLSVISHELRTPLNPIIGFTDMMLASNPGEEFESYLEMIHRCGRDLLKMINSIFDFLQVDSGESLGQKAKTDVAHVLNDGRDLALSILGKDSPIEVSQRILENGEPTDSLPKLETWNDAIRQIVANLVANACKFTQEGRIELTADLQTAGKSATWLEITVADTGIGIRKEDQERVFNIFTQVDQSISRSYEGLGLGLAICRQQAKRIDATLHLDSELGKGSTFKLRILIDEIAPPDEVADENTEKQTDPNLLRGKRCLVVDDNATNLNVLISLLQRLGAEAVGAQAGEAAIQAISDLGFDYIFLDLILADENGFELAQRIRDLELKRQPTIVAVTSEPNLSGSSSIEESVFDSALQKPIGLPELAGHMKQHI